MKRMMCKVLCIAMVMAMCLALAPSAMAVTYTGIAGPSSVTLADYLVVEKNATVLSYQFDFTLTAGTAASNVKAGKVVMTGTQVTAPTVASITIASANKVVTPTPEQVSALGDKYSAANNDVYEKDVKLDFSGVTFTEPGVYRYVLTQTEGSIPGVSYDENNIRYVDVYVQNKYDDNGNMVPGQLAIQSTVVHTDGEAAGFNFNVGANQSMPGIGNKSEAFVNTLSTVNLTLAKKITGNQANLNEKFAFTISIELPDGAANGVFNIETVPAGGTVSGDSNITTATSDGKNKGSATVNLGKDDKIAINGLPVGTKVTITETNNNTYVTSYVVGTAASVTGNALTIDELNNNTDVVFTNDRTGTIPTGVLLTIAPFAVLMIVGLVGVVVFLKKKRND